MARAQEHCCFRQGAPPDHSPPTRPGVRSAAAAFHAGTTALSSVPFKVSGPLCPQGRHAGAPVAWLLPFTLKDKLPLVGPKRSAHACLQQAS